MRRREAGRLRWLLGVAGATACLLVGRAAYVTLFLHDELSARAKAQQTNVREIPAPRGPILDRQGRTLACSVENPSLALAGGDLAETGRLAAELCRLGLCTRETAERIAVPAAEFRWVTRRWVPDQVATDLAARFDFVRVEREMKRFYPAGPVAPQVLGFVGTDGSARSGLEVSFNKWLSGEPGRRIEFVTGGGNPQQTMPPQILRDARPGGGLVLTIDARVDEVVRFRLREGMEQVNADKGFVIVMDPWTGEILALCGEPGFDPCSPNPVAADRLKACAVMDQFEPGSIFKVNTFAAALESGLVSPDDMIDCMGGTRIVAGRPIHDLKKMGRVTAAEVLIYSSNIGNGVVAEQIGWERVSAMAQALGFGQPTGIPLAGEAAGKLPHPLEPGYSSRTLLTVAYGQEVSVTGLQMALAYAAVANGGLLMKPLLVRGTLDADGNVATRAEPEVVRRVMSPETAATLTRLFRRVVSEGTGKAAEVPYLPPAGKTGTAQVYDPVLRTYSPDQHVLSFVGFAPYTNPRCLVAVCLFNRGPQHGGDAAAPIFARIIQDLVWLLEEGGWESAPVRVSAEAAVLVPDVRGLDPQAARRVLHQAGLLPVLIGSGARVERHAPQPYASVPRGTVVELTLAGENREGTVSMPKLEGLSLRRAVTVLTEMGLEVGVNGSGWIVEQFPPDSSEVALGTLCILTASPGAARAREASLRRSDLACREADNLGRTAAR